MNEWLITLKPKYVEKILKGFKRVEIRTRIPSKLNVNDIIYVVQSGSGGKIMFLFKVKFIKAMATRIVWDQYHAVAGISLEKYYEYARGRELMYVIGITEVREVSDLSVKRAPQWFGRYNEVLMDKL